MICMKVLCLYCLTLIHIRLVTFIALCARPVLITVKMNNPYGQPMIIKRLYGHRRHGSVCPLAHYKIAALKNSSLVVKKCLIAFNPNAAIMLTLIRMAKAPGFKIILIKQKVHDSELRIFVEPIASIDGKINPCMLVVVNRT